MLLRVAVTLLVVSATLGVDVREIDTLDFASVNASVLIDAYVSRGVPVKLRHEDPKLESWVATLGPHGRAGGGAQGWRNRPTTAHIAAIEAMQLFPVDDTDAIHLSIPQTTPSEIRT